MSEKVAPVEKRRAKENVLYTRLTPETFKHVYKVSVQSGFTMSEIARLCIERALPAVEKGLADLKRV